MKNKETLFHYGVYLYVKEKVNEFSHRIDDWIDRMSVMEININEKSRKWLKCAGIRALKTMAQTAIATIGSTAVISAVNWPIVISATVLSGGLSLLTSVAGLPECK